MSRVPRKKKKKLTTFSFDLSVMEWDFIRKAARSEGVRPTEYIILAIRKYVEVLRNDETK